MVYYIFVDYYFDIPKKNMVIFNIVLENDEISIKQVSLLVIVEEGEDFL